MLSEAQNACTDVMESYRRDGVAVSIDQQLGMLAKAMSVSTGLAYPELPK